MKALIIDIETTNFLNKGGKIIEVGATEIDFKNTHFKVKFDRRCYQDDLTIEEIKDSWIAANSNILDSWKRDAEPIEVVLKELQELINKYPLGCTAFNNRFDFEFLESYGIEFPKKLNCPMKLATNVCKLPNLKHGVYKWPKVQEAFDFFFPNNSYVEKHRGADDSLHEAKIVYKLYELGIFKLS